MDPTTLDILAKLEARLSWERNESVERAKREPLARWHRGRSSAFEKSLDLIRQEMAWLKQQTEKTREDILESA